MNNIKKWIALGLVLALAVAAGAAAAETLQIGIPDDGTNLSRGIKLLETAGLITVNPEAGYTPELADITGYLYNVEVVPVQANTLPSTLADFGASTINGTYAIPYGLIPSRDGLIIEKQSEAGDNPYVNIIVARTADQDNETYQTDVSHMLSTMPKDYLKSPLTKIGFAQYDYVPYSKPLDASSSDSTGVMPWEYVMLSNNKVQVDLNEGAVDFGSDHMMSDNRISMFVQREDGSVKPSAEITGGYNSTLVAESKLYLNL